ncbi:MaoC family dehydratase [Kibdelosporangium philippinense]|uniref:MaoC family dehydratase n=1 Tax=Kibdelosporangium philippinense TaxID=211113 RepID=A0ABS8ZY27_9PSEU|nr:MaoC family dehydratase [Kibdelosporangium philippinense]MCE7012145.1 MaoC family dehydratase [Kibdelosporangium philippinense]
MTTRAHGLAGLKALAGKDLGHTGWWEITQDRVNTFADATDDHQWIHVDPARAAEGPFKTTIAHGYLTLSLLPALSSELLVIEGVGMGINYGLDRVRFPAPVPVGSKIRLTGIVVSVDEVQGDGVQMVRDLTVEIDGSEKPACVARWVSRHYA